MIELTYGLLRRARLRMHGESPFALGLFAFVYGGISIAVMALGAYATGELLVFPSLGATAFLLFYSPLSPSASPRNTMAGHAIGLAAGYLSLYLFGLRHTPAVLIGGINLQWAGAAALSLAITAGLMAWLRVPHPPAGATTLMVSLGILPHIPQLLGMLASVLALVLEGLILNRLAGIPYPYWSPAEPENSDSGD